VLRRIFGPKRDVVMRSWMKLHNEELHNLYCSTNIIRVIKSRKMRWAGHVVRMGEMRNVVKILVGKPERNKPRGRPRRRREDNIKMNLRKICLEALNWIRLAQNRDRWRAIVNTVVYLRVPSKAGNFLTS
jgi:hypothetical protein